MFTVTLNRANELDPDGSLFSTLALEAEKVEVHELAESVSEVSVYTPNGKVENFFIMKDTEAELPDHVIDSDLERYNFVEVINDNGSVVLFATPGGDCPCH